MRTYLSLTNWTALRNTPKVSRTSDNLDARESIERSSQSLEEAEEDHNDNNDAPISKKI